MGIDEVAELFDFNDHAYRRFVETIKVSLSSEPRKYSDSKADKRDSKDSLDPNGILSPGKMGIWPRRFREKAEDVAHVKSVAQSQVAADQTEVPISTEAETNGV